MTSVTKLCKVALHTTAIALNKAAKDSPVAIARNKLGDERMAKIITDSLKKSIYKLITDPSEEAKKDLSSPHGNIAAATILADIVAKALNELVAEAN